MFHNDMLCYILPVEKSKVKVTDVEMPRSFFGRKSTPVHRPTSSTTVYSVPSPPAGMVAVRRTADFLVIIALNVCVTIRL